MDVLYPIRSSLVSRDRPLERNEPDPVPDWLVVTHRSTGIGSHPDVFHIGSSRPPPLFFSSPSGRLSQAAGLPRPVASGVASGGEARLPSRGKAAPLPAVCAPSRRAAPKRPEARLPSSGKAAGRESKNKEGSKGSCKARGGGRGERGSRPALLPESR